MKKIIALIIVLLLLLSIFLLFRNHLVIKIRAQELPAIVINEIMYNPTGADSGHEWLEIVNVSTSTDYAINSSWRFNDGGNHLLSVIQGDGSLSAGQYGVIAENSGIFLQDYPDYQGILINTVMSLANTQDTLSLSIDSGQTLFATTTYQAAWGGADNGFSLERINLLSGDQAQDWQQSFVASGTPGRINSQAPRQDEEEVIVTNSSPIVEIGPDVSARVGESISFTASATDPEGGELSFVWDFGDGITSSARVVSHLYNQAGSYNVLLNVSDGHNLASDTLAVSVSEILEENQQQNHQAPLPSIIINELLPNPSGPDSEQEFIELYNPNNSYVDLSSWRLVDAGNNSFTLNAINSFSPLIQSSGYLVLYSRQSGISLNNSGDTIKLIQSNGVLSDEVSYSGLVAINYSYSRLGSNWQWTIEPTPGEENTIKNAESVNGAVSVAHNTAVASSSATTSVLSSSLAKLNYRPEDYQGLRINEFLPNPAGPDSTEWIELYNATSTALSFSGFSLDDSSGGSRPYFFSASSSISALGYLVINKKDSGLSLNNDQDAVRLLDPEGQIFQQIDYQKSLSGQSYNFEPNEEEWFWSASTTPGLANIFPPADLSLAAEEIAQSDFGETDNQLLTISEVKELAKGVKVKVAGAVTAPLGILSKRSVYVAAMDLAGNIINLNEGLQIYASNPVKLADLKLGDVVGISGLTSEASGEKRINFNKDSQLDWLSKLTVPEPGLVFIADLNDDLIGALITVSGQLLEKKGNNYYLDDGTGEIRVSAKSGTIKPVVKAGETLEVSGILTLAKDGYRLLPRFKEDFQVAQVLGEQETMATSSEIVNMPVDHEKNKVMKYLLAGGGGILTIIVSWLAKLKLSAKG